MPAAASARTRAPTPGGKRSSGPQPQAQPGAGTSAVTTSAATPAVVPTASTLQAGAGTGRARSW